MANEISEAKKGLAAALSGIDGLRVFDYTPDSLHEFPAAIVHLESRDSVGTLGGGAIRGSMRVEVLVSTADARQATETLDAFLEPTGAQSIEAAANTDPTWRGSVDDSPPHQREQHRQAQAGWCGLHRRGLSLLVREERVGVRECPRTRLK